MNAQQGETEKLIDFDLYINNEFKFYLNEVIAGVTHDKFDIDTHGTSKFLFHHFNNLRCDLGEKPYKVWHTIISDNKDALEILQNKDWPYFINRLLEVSNGGISSLSLLSIGQNQNNVEELKVIGDDTIENLEKCKNYYADIYADVGGFFKIT